VTGRPGPQARPWLLIAAVAAVVSLGLPWKKTVELGFGYTYYGNGLCYNSYDADGWMTTICDPYWTPQLEVKPQLATLIGTEHPVRVLALLAVVALIAGYRRHSRRLVLAAPVLACVGLLGFGVTGMSGQVLFVLAVAALAMALRRDGILPGARTLMPTG
jgi:hypothetical protein